MHSSPCTLLEDLKALELSYEARLDLLTALTTHSDNFASDNAYNESRIGIKIEPAAPEFSPNFPSVITVPIYSGNLDPEDPFSDIEIDKDWERDTAITVRGAFTLVPSNLAPFPVFDRETGRMTNGCEKNQAFDVGGYGRTELHVWEFYQIEGGPYIKPGFEDIVREYENNPIGEKWWFWEYVGGGTVQYDENGKPFVEGEELNPIDWNPFNISKYRITQCSCLGTFKVDPYNGYVDFIFRLDDFPPDVFVSQFNSEIKIKSWPFTIQNGNGKAQKEITFRIVGNIAEDDITDDSYNLHSRPVN